MSARLLVVYRVLGIPAKKLTDLGPCPTMQDKKACLTQSYAHSAAFFSPRTFSS